MDPEVRIAHAEPVAQSSNNGVANEPFPLRESFQASPDVVRTVREKAVDAAHDIIGLDVGMCTQYHDNFASGLVDRQVDGRGHNFLRVL